MVDAEVAWSHRGHLIAFHRRLASSLGPPGLYAVPATGGAPTLIAVGDFFYPTQLSFSHDDAYVVCNIGDQIYKAPLDGAGASPLFYTHNGARDPDCSPVGEVIVYRRTQLYPGEPLDSAGIHIFDAGTGSDTAFRVAGVQIGGTGPKWSPRGDEFCTLSTTPNLDSRVTAIDAMGRGTTILATLKQPSTLAYMLWYQRPLDGTYGVRYFVQNGTPTGGVHFVARASGTDFRALDQVTQYVAFSPDGEFLVSPDWDAESQSIVLFVRRFNDISTASRRRLTTYSAGP